MVHTSLEQIRNKYVLRSRLPKSSLKPELDRMREKLGRGMAANGKSARQKDSKKKKKDSKGLITADAGILSSQGSLVKRVKKWWPFRASSSWESAAIATCTIFVFCAPVLLSGLSVPGFLSLFLISLFTWRAFEYQGFLIVVLYFLLVSFSKISSFPMSVLLQERTFLQECSASQFRIA